MSKYKLFNSVTLPELLSALFQLFFHAFIPVHISLRRSSSHLPHGLLFTNPSHLANDYDSGENTGQENPHRLPRGCAKVGTNTLLKKNHEQQTAGVRNKISVI